MEKFTDKESLIDTLHTKAKITDKDYRVRFLLNNETSIFIITAATSFNGIGQSSFAAALASSLNIGFSVFDTKLGKFTSDICLIP